MLADPRMLKNKGKATLNEIFDKDDLKCDSEEASYDKVFVGKIPVILC
jgi:hypothetical protein